MAYKIHSAPYVNASDIAPGFDEVDDIPFSFGDTDITLVTAERFDEFIREAAGDKLPLEIDRKLCGIVGRGLYVNLAD